MGQRESSHFSSPGTEGIDFDLDRQKCCFYQLGRMLVIAECSKVKSRPRETCALPYLVKNQVERIFKVLKVVTKRNLCRNPRVVKTFYN